MKSRNIVLVIVVLAVIGGIVWATTRNSEPKNVVPDPLQPVTGTTTIPLPVSGTTKVSSNLSQYSNAELGFSVEYPTVWQKADTTNGVQFIIPIDQSQVSTVNRLDVETTVSASKCAFPPVTTIQERETITVAGMPVNMISMSRDVQGRSYFNRMYSLQKGSICYFFNLTYIALSPESKSLTGSNKTQAENNNKAIKNTADAAFTAMVKSFEFVAPPEGQSETQAAPVKK